MLSAIDDPHWSMSLQTSGKLIELTHSDGKLRVHYSDRLVTLLREVRKLSTFGYTILHDQQTAATAAKFYKYGIILKQVTALMSVDLLRQQQRWRDALVDIRQMMATLVQE
ncbi:cytoplasmic dynein 2 heavy chain 1-like [Dysidea avara]|uniref:cytoplasmic dynein 2 heavy chain 1-like n=1 Tax=Dysidea avara TaxID=196820 RepID=UPI003328C701